MCKVVLWYTETEKKIKKGLTLTSTIIGDRQSAHHPENNIHSVMTFSFLGGIEVDMYLEDFISLLQATNRT